MKLFDSVYTKTAGDILARKLSEEKRVKDVADFRSTVDDIVKTLADQVALHKGFRIDVERNTMHSNCFYYVTLMEWRGDAVMQWCDSGVTCLKFYRFKDGHILGRVDGEDNMPHKRALNIFVAKVATYIAQCEVG